METSKNINQIENAGTEKESNVFVKTPEYQVHLETLVTPAYSNLTSAKSIMEVLDGMINTYLRETKSTLINVVHFGFDDVDDNNIKGFVRIAVQRPTINWVLDKLKDSINELPLEMMGDETDGKT